jgi:hypothetical protein
MVSGHHPMDHEVARGRGNTGEATADSATSSPATEIAIPIHVVVIIVPRETNARPTSRARQSSERLVELRGKPTESEPIASPFPESFQI